MSSKKHEIIDYNLNMDFVVILEYITNILNRLVDVKLWIMDETPFAWIQKVQESS